MVDLNGLLECNIENIIQSIENEDSILLQKIYSMSLAFCSDITSRIDRYFDHMKESLEKIKYNSESFHQINQQIKSSIHELDAVRLNQKITEREIANIIKRHEKLQETLRELREQRERVSLEIVDLEHELEERKKEKKLDYDALKRACNFYKHKLDIRIQVNTCDDIENVSITFFPKEYGEKYYVILSHKGKSWRVKKIEPDLKAQHRSNLSTVIDFTNDFQVKNITEFLCRLRHIFLEHYC